MLQRTTGSTLGFSLIELLTVLVIIAVSSSMGLFVITNAKQRALEKEAEVKMSALFIDAESSRLEDSEYPTVYDETKSWRFKLAPLSTNMAVITATPLSGEGRSLNALVRQGEAPLFCWKVQEDGDEPCLSIASPHL